jgi:acetyl-CoA carboxylase biotin carboxyl carrier protein
MAILGFDIEEIARLLALMESGELEEIEWEEANRYLKVASARRPELHMAPPVHASPSPSHMKGRIAPPRRQSAQKAIGQAPIEPAEDEIALVSPMVGVYYRAGKPGDPPLVEVGQLIAKDQPIGIIEAMKIFSEIPAEHGGVIAAIPAKDGQLVQAGTPLVILKKQA